MIVSRDINPERDFYYLGGKVITILSNTTAKEIAFFDLFEKMNASTKISINLFTLTLDWLFLIGVINKSNTGNLIKCF